MKPADGFEVLEEIFPESKKSIRVLSLFLRNPDEAYTKYMVEKLVAVNKAGDVLERLTRLGILRLVDDNPKAYKLNDDSTLAKKLLRLLEQL
uniref:ArsR family transcriptional regulator n=1 Tax=Thermofilum pendens TaxID=2269 RepID=A0A7C3WKB1_THEPE